MLFCENYFAVLVNSRRIGGLKETFSAAGLEP